MDTILTGLLDKSFKSVLTINQKLTKRCAQSAEPFHMFYYAAKLRGTVVHVYVITFLIVFVLNYSVIYSLSLVNKDNIYIPTCFL